ncbi:MAG: glycoside hydrolase [Anaerolineae bacterium]|nr:glycoside hydrolase [Anaerolineae bacterium]
MYWSEVKYQPERTRTFLGSPSIVRLPDGVLLATHDYFGPGCPRNHEGEESLTSVYRSEDDGATWQNATHIMNCYWSTLFLHGGSVYILGTSQQYGSILIRRSDDGGFTWTHPADEQTGILFRGGFYHDPPNYHCAPVPVVFHNGRIWKAFEDLNPAQWGRYFHACVISAPDDSDLLDAANWTMSNKLVFDPAWIPEDWGELDNPGWLEGNVVVTPDGELYDLLRFNSNPLVDKAAIVKLSADGTQLSFDPADFIDFPGGITKFSIRRDPLTGLYLSLVNEYTQSITPRQRNILTLAVSENLRDWRLVKRLMEDDTGLSPEDSVRLTGFQYVDWQFDGDDLIYLVRTAYRGAIRYHDSNRIIYRVLRNFRSLL